MNIINLIHHYQSQIVKTGFNLIMRAALISLLGSLLMPGLTAADDLVKPEGSAETDISI